MQALDLLLPQPPFDLPSEKQAAFETLIESSPSGSYIDFHLSYPKWQFLSYLCTSRDLVLHGSQNNDLEIMEPRRAIDVKAFSAQEAIYATTDGIWAIFFAIVDRQRFQPLSLFNSCLDIRLSPEQVLGPLYFFSITHSAWIQRPWCDGTVYVLPRENFIQEPGQPMAGAEIIFPHWISFTRVSPIAKIKVDPQDFPFLANVHAHNNEKLLELITSDPNGFPWPEALEN